MHWSEVDFIIRKATISVSANTLSHNNANIMSGQQIASFYLNQTIDIPVSCKHRTVDHLSILGFNVALYVIKLSDKWAVKQSL